MRLLFFLFALGFALPELEGVALCEWLEEGVGVLEWLVEGVAEWVWDEVIEWEALGVCVRVAVLVWLAECEWEAEGVWEWLGEAVEECETLWLGVWEWDTLLDAVCEWEVEGVAECVCDDVTLAVALLDADREGMTCPAGGAAEGDVTAFSLYPSFASASPVLSLKYRARALAAMSVAERRRAVPLMLPPWPEEMAVSRAWTAWRM